MKKTYILLLFILASCSSSKVALINSYLKEDINKNNYKNNSVIVKEKEKPSEAIRIVFGWKEKNKYTGSQQVDEKDYTFLTAKYKNDTIQKYWNDNEFSINNLSIKEYKQIEELFKKKTYNTTDLINGYSFSEPIFIKNKNLAFFKVYKFQNHSRIVQSFVVVMKKMDSKWIEIEKIEDTNIYN